MRENLEQTKGLIHSQRVLLALTEAGLGRQEAYAIVQSHALDAWRHRQPLLDRLRTEPEVTQRISRKLSGLFDLGYHTRHVDAIFRRVFGEDPKCVLCSGAGGRPADAWPPPRRRP